MNPAASSDPIESDRRQNRAGVELPARPPDHPARPVIPGGTDLSRPSRLKAKQSPPRQQVGRWLGAGRHESSTPTPVNPGRPERLPRPQQRWDHAVVNTTPARQPECSSVGLCSTTSSISPYDRDLYHSPVMSVDRNLHPLFRSQRLDSRNAIRSLNSRSVNALASPSGINDVEISRLISISSRTNCRS